MPDRKSLFTLPENSDYVYSVAFSPDGKTLASASADGSIRLWDSTTGECLVILILQPLQFLSGWVYYPYQHIKHLHQPETFAARLQRKSQSD
ncbi:MAG: hypothetical protein HY820_31285 [Acidobacteria bacterium]|nr:hypothetical protein [Acidobacteriota bacterium]